MSVTEPPVRALVFDIGRVIVRVNVNQALEGLGGASGLSTEEVWTAIQANPHWQDWQEGRMDPHQWHERLAQRFGFRLTFDEFCVTWNRVLDPETILSERLFAKLAASHRLVLLSNTDPIHAAHLEACFPFVQHFAGRVFSCRVGASKPAPAVYRKAVQESGAPAEQVLYVDDVKEYVQAGQRCGMQGLLFQGKEPLLDELRRRGILLA